jgi:pimeloyl-ACP methyl ester carboxylesterase
MATIDDIKSPIPSDTPTNEPTPTTLPTPIPTVIPTPTPVPVSRNPLIFLPGMVGSWNFWALAHGVKVDNSQWSLTPFTNTYEGIIKAFENAGYVKDKDLFVYTYDWRKEITNTASDLRDFIYKHVLKNKPPETKIDLVGHCMGGLIARAAANDDHLNKNINMIITSGSPNLGSALAYPLWEGADTSFMPTDQRIGLQIMLELNAIGFNNQVDEIRSLSPSIQNFLPLWNFLKDKNGKLIDNNKLLWKNNELTSINQNIPNLTSKLGVLIGSGSNTINYFLVDKASENEQMLGKWADGKPISTEWGDGDDTLTIDSGKIANANYFRILSNKNHGELMTNPVGQVEILKLLGINNPVGFDTPEEVYDNAVVAFVASPATIKVIDPDGNIYLPAGGIILIPNPVNGNYQTILNSTGAGHYTVYFGRLKGGNTAWDEDSGMFSKSGEMKTYLNTVNFEENNLGADPLGDAIKRITNLQNNINNPHFSFIFKHPISEYLELMKNLITKLHTGNDKYKIATTTAILRQINLALNISGNWNMFYDFAGQLRLVKIDIDQYLNHGL